MDTPKTEEKTTNGEAEGNKSEAPKKKKNIIRVYHAQNASDGGKGRRKPAAGERKPAAQAQPARSSRTADRSTEAAGQQTQETAPKAEAPKCDSGAKKRSEAPKAEPAKPFRARKQKLQEQSGRDQRKTETASNVREEGRDSGGEKWKPIWPGNRSGGNGDRDVRGRQGEYVGKNRGPAPG